MTAPPKDLKTAPRIATEESLACARRRKSGPKPKSSAKLRRPFASLRPGGDVMDDDRIAELCAAFAMGESLEDFESLIEAMVVQANRKFLRKDQESKTDAFCDLLILRELKFPENEIPAALCRVYKFPITVARNKVVGSDATGLTKMSGREKFDDMTELQRIERLQLFKK